MLVDGGDRDRIIERAHDGRGRESIWEIPGIGRASIGRRNLACVGFESPSRYQFGCHRIHGRPQSRQVMFDELVLQHGDFVYARVKAIAWVANKALLPTVLQADAGDVLARTVEQIGPEKPLVLNCQGVSDIDRYAARKLAEARRRTGRQLLLTDAAHLEESLRRSLGSHDVPLADQDGKHGYIYGASGLTQELATKLATAAN